jgi:hypothetical protein
MSTQKAKRTAVTGKSSNRQAKQIKRLEEKLRAEKGQVKQVNSLVKRVRDVKLADRLVVAEGARIAATSTRKALEKRVPKKTLTKAEAHAVAIVTLPMETAPLRINNGWSSYPTSAVKLFKQEEVVYNNPTVSPATNGDDNTFIALFRSALCSRIQQYELDNTKVSSLYSGFVNMTIPQNEYAVFNPRALQFGLNSNTAQYQSIQAPLGGALDDDYHGPYLYPCRLGRSDPHRGFWVNDGDVCVFAVHTAPGQGQVFRIEIMELIGENWVNYANYSFPNAQQQHTLLFSPSNSNALGSYLCYKITNVTIAGASVAQVYFPCSLLVFSGVGSVITTNFIVSANPSTSVSAASTTVYAHRALPEIEANFSSMSDVKINGLSAMFTNTSQALTRQGEFAGLQVNENKIWQDHAFYSKINGLAGVKFTKADEGMYGFIKPTSPSDMADFLGEFETFNVASIDPANFRSTGPAGLSDGAFIMPPNKPYIVMCGIQSASVSRTGVYTMAWQIEYKTLSQWRELAIPETSIQSIEVGVRALASMPQWHKNDFHLDDVWNWLKDAAGTVVNGIIEYGPTVLKGAAMLAPLLL